MGKRRRTSRGRQVDGIVVVDKVKGASSNDVLQRVKGLFGAAKAGHTGSLDPFTTSPSASPVVVFTPSWTTV